MTKTKAQKAKRAHKGPQPEPSTGKKKARKRAKKAKKAPMGGQQSCLNLKTTRISVTNPLLAGKNIVSSSGFIPSAFVEIMGNSTYISSPTAVMHPELGIQGINLHGCQPLANIQQVTSSAAVFVNTTLATQIDQSSIYLSPDTLNGPLAAQANLHSKYVFRDIMIEYISSCATTVPGAMCLAYSEAGSDADPTTFSLARQVVPSVTFPYRADRAYLHYNYAGPQLFKTLTTANTTAIVNEFSNQGVILGLGDATVDITGIGFTNIYYSIDLYGPISTQGFTMAFDSREERFIFQAILSQLKKGKVALASLLSYFNIDMSTMPRITCQSRQKDSSNYLSDLKSLSNSLALLPVAVSSSKDRGDSITDDEDWKCRPSSSSVPLKKPGNLPDLSNTIDKAKAESKLSDSVVDLIASKLRK